MPGDACPADAFREANGGRIKGKEVGSPEGFED